MLIIYYTELVEIKRLKLNRLGILRLSMSKSDLVDNKLK